METRQSLLCHLKMSNPGLIGCQSNLIPPPCITPVYMTSLELQCIHTVCFCSQTTDEIWWHLICLDAANPRILPIQYFWRCFLSINLTSGRRIAFIITLDKGLVLELKDVLGHTYCKVKKCKICYCVNLLHVVLREEMHSICLSGLEGWWGLLRNNCVCLQRNSIDISVHVCEPWSHCNCVLMFYREKLEPRGLMGKLDLWDLRGPLGSPVLRDCVEFLALLWVHLVHYPSFFFNGLKCRIKSC